MSCWVVPTIAAEFLGIPLAQVLERARLGTMPSKTELGFMMVDVAPHSPRIVGGIRMPASRPATYVELPSAEITLEERQVLGREEDETVAQEPPLTREELAELNPPLEVQRRPMVVIETAEGPDLDDEPEEGRLDWRDARRHAARQRRAPQRMAAGMAA